MEITIYRGTSNLSAGTESRYYTECIKIAKTYIGWRKGSDGGELITKTVSPKNVFNANSKDGALAAQKIAVSHGWNADYVKRFAGYYDNKPNSAFTGMIIALEIANRENGVTATDEENETAVVDILRESGYDFVTQTEIGGSPYLDGSFHFARRKHIAWISLN